MCYIGYFKSEKQCRTTEKDIKCFKICRMKRNKIVSYFQDFPYELNKLYKEDLKTNDNYNEDTIIIYIGFHSYNYVFKTQKIGNRICLTNEKTNESICCGPGTVKVDCIIPKGSQYYKDERGKMVSSQIILTKVTEL